MNTEKIPEIDIGSNPIAIIADTHSNLEALEAVLADIAEKEIEVIVMAGDVVGYGPDPIACIDRVMGLNIVISGNHDYAISTPAGVREQLDHGLPYESGLGNLGRINRADPRYMKFLESLPKQALVHTDAFDLDVVHGSPRKIHEYLFPPIKGHEHDYKPDLITEIISGLQRSCVVGHTHIPAVLFNGGFFVPTDADNEYEIPAAEPVIINPGAVGQPRDNDYRASYAVLQGNKLTFHRVDYDLIKTCERIKESMDIYFRAGIQDMACMLLGEHL